MKITNVLSFLLVGVFSVTLKADLPVDMDYDAALLEAAASGNPSLVGELINAGANVNVRDRRGSSPLHIASGKGYSEVVRKLIKSGALINAVSHGENGFAPIHFATYWNQFDVLKILERSGARLDITTHKGNTPAHLAAGKCNTNFTDYLLEKEADVDSTNKLGNTPLHFVAAFCDDNQFARTMVYKHRAYFHANNKYDQMAIHFAAQYGNVEVLKALLRYGCYVDPKDVNGQTPLHYAYKNGHAEAANLLLKYRAKPRTRDHSGRRPADLAKSADFSKILNDLRDRDR